MTKPNRIGRFGWLCLAIALCQAAVNQARAAIACETCPPTAQGNAVNAGISVFKVNPPGTTPQFTAVTGGTVNECSTLLILTSVSYSPTAPGPSGSVVASAFYGGDGHLLVDEGNNGTIESTVDVTPTDMATTIVGPGAAGGCIQPSVGTKDMKAFFYSVPHGITTVQFSFVYAHGTALLAGCTDEASGSQERTVTFTACNPSDVCHTAACGTQTITYNGQQVLVRDGICAQTTINCDDGNPCTVDTCDTTVVSGNACVHTPLSCDDHNACTTDSCNSNAPAGTNPCVHTDISCNDNNPCTTDVCNPDAAVGTNPCSHTNISCNDNNPCTTDTCNAQSTSGDPCVHTNISCNDNNPCTTDTCNAQSTSGDPCVHTNISCSDNNPCTTDTCNPQATTGDPCVHTNISCNDNNPCTVDTCNAQSTGGDPCVHTNISCDDNNPCTTDSCNSQATTGDPCVHVTRVCQPTDPKCFTAVCDPSTGNCVQLPKPPIPYTFKCPPDIELPCGSPTDPAHTGGTCVVTGPLNPDGSLPVVTITWEDNLIDANCTGKRGIIRIFYATDECGNKQPCNFGQKITFKDTTPPVITCRGDLVTCDPNPILACATATDNCEQPVTITYTRSDGKTISCGTVDGRSQLVSSGPFPAGTTIVTATATDSCGNKSTCTFKVTVNSIICGFNECCCNLCPGQTKTIRPNYYGGVGPYTFVWTRVESGEEVLRGTGDAFASFTTGLAGHYKVTITDSMGCTCTTGDYQITVDNLKVLVNADCNDLAVCNGSSVTLSGAFSGGVAPFKYLWEQVTPNGTISMGTDSSVSVSQPGIYRLTVIDASCQASLDTVVLSCAQCVTRDADYWLKNVIAPPGVVLPAGAKCATLQEVFNIQAFNIMNLGFLDVTLNEAVGLFWSPLDQTGGTGTDQVFGNAVCKARKQLSQQLIAAIANVSLLNRNSASCGVVDPNTGCFYPIQGLIQEAQAATTQEPGIFDCFSQAAWLNEMASLTTWLQMFNTSGTSQPLPSNLVECGLSLQDAAYVRDHQGDDPTRASNCACQ